MTPSATGQLSVVLAGGGSAGHTSPLIATADALRRRDPNVRLTAVGTERGLETRVIPAAGLPLELIPPVPLPRRPTADLFRVPGRLRTAVRRAKQVLAEAEADVVVGFGGYVAMPVYLAARSAKLPIVVHEQNVVPGLANKVAARFADRVAVSFPDTPLRGGEFIGLPVRRGITGLDRAARRAQAARAVGLDPNRPTLLVSGGSLGARSINTAVVGARDELLAGGIQILHVLGLKNIAETDVIIEHASGARYVPVGYVDEMADAYALADLMLCRSGAGTVVETAVIGLPAVFVPLPHGNGEQQRNAAPVIDAGGAKLITDADCTPETVASLVIDLITDAGVLRHMGEAARSVMPADADERLASMIVDANGRTGGSRRSGGEAVG
ncbi:MAG: undecaprenyldiphospho-muramoylpentapeptide beta-N-acetylglucosaminyltransferase [Propionibacteriales bacterium]|nr:undecaprenyldiphospho-muramoylpentapeptide beta-N-acetylglucosaminyltransferase [Propionibacteriales bacterium]